MAKIFPAGLRTVRNLEPLFSYFLVTKKATRILSDLPLREYFVYKYKVPVSEKRGKSDISSHFSTETLDSIMPLNDTDYSVGLFQHPKYTNQDEVPLSFPYRDLPIYEQKEIGKIEIINRIPSLGGVPPLKLAK